MPTYVSNPGLTPGDLEFLHFDPMFTPGTGRFISFSHLLRLDAQVHSRKRLAIHLVRSWLKLLIKKPVELKRASVGQQS